MTASRGNGSRSASCARGGARCAARGRRWWTIDQRIRSVEHERRGRDLARAGRNAAGARRGRRRRRASRRELVRAATGPRRARAPSGGPAPLPAHPLGELEAVRPALRRAAEQPVREEVALPVTRRATSSRPRSGPISRAELAVDAHRGSHMRMTEPRVTASCPCTATTRRFLAEAAASLLAQTLARVAAARHRHREDAADFSAALGDAAADERVRIVRNEGRKLAGALNTGMRRATTEFTAILLADDLWAPEAVEVLESAHRALPGRRLLPLGARASSTATAARSAASQPARDDVHARRLRRRVARQAPPVLAAGARRSRSAGSTRRSTASGRTTTTSRGRWRRPARGSWRSRSACTSTATTATRYRLTTHLPLSVHVREMRRILRKHGVDEERIEAIIEEARTGIPPAMSVPVPVRPVGEDGLSLRRASRVA